MKKLNIFLTSFFIFGAVSLTDIPQLETKDAHAYSISISEDLGYYNKYVFQKMRDAMYQGKLKAPDYIKSDIIELSEKGYCSFSGTKAYASKPLLDLLYSLVISKQVTKDKPFSILSLFRRGRNHGAFESNGIIIGRSIDIDIYSGHRIHMNTPYDSLKAIIKVINNMPEGRYNVGLPRPGGGNSLDPSKDFFLPVNSLSQNERSPTGTLMGDLKLIKNNEARELISMAVNRNKRAQILYMMPDAVDHLHIKALDDGKLY
jgi:hypothetical protein